MTNPAAAWLLLTTRSIGVEMTPGGHGHLTAADVAAALKHLRRGPFLLGMAALAGDESVKRELARVVHREIVVELSIDFAWQTEPGSQIYRRLAALSVFELLNGQRCVICNGKGICPRDVVEQRPLSIDARREKDVRERAELIRKIRLLRRTEWFARQIEISAEHMAEHGCRPVEKQLLALRRSRTHIEALEAEIEAVDQGVVCRSCKGTGLIKRSDRETGRPKLTEVQRAWAAGISRKQWYRLWIGRYAVIQGELERWHSECLNHVRRWLDGQAAA